MINARYKPVLHIHKLNAILVECIMSRSKDSYIIEVHYPEDEGVFEIRKRMGAAYIQFVIDYILALHISDEEKNKLYTKVTEMLYGKIILEKE